MTPAKAVFFDLDATLVYLDSAVLEEKMARVCAAVAASNGLDPASLQTQHRWRVPELWQLADTGAMDGVAVMRETWRCALAACGCDSETAAWTAFDLFWSDRLGIVRLFDDVATTLAQLRGRLPTAVITNGPADTQFDKLQVTGFDNYFDLFLASSELGVLKPDPRIFARACEKLNVTPGDVWHVGDSLATDVAGAKAAGLTAIWLNRGGVKREQGQQEPDFEIQTLTELPPLLGIFAE